MDEITINIDCYQCGTKLEVSFRLSDSHAAEYRYCPECGEGVQVYFTKGVIDIDRLSEQFS